MITELAIMGLTTAAYRVAKSTFKHRHERAIKNSWDEALQNCKIEGIRNKNDETFKITSIYPRKFGYLCFVNIPDGLQYEMLDKAKRVLEDKLNCLIEIEKQRFKEYISVKLVSKILEFEYAPVKTSANELFLGHKLDGSKYIVDLNKDPHILIAGKTGTGKSFLFASILTNLIYNNSKGVDIYLFQVMKSEIDIFQNCPGIKFTSDKKVEIEIMLEKLTVLIHKRSKQFAENGIKNITQWNKHFPNKTMKRIVIGAEEISFFMDVENVCFTYFNEIVKAGRSAGIHFIGLSQRTTSKNLGGNGELKSQLTVITARQRSEVDSQNAIDITDAAHLEQQEFIASANDGYITFKAPTVDEDFKCLNKYVPEIVIPMDSDKKEVKEKPVLRGGWHIPTPEEWMKVKHDIPDLMIVREEALVPMGQLKQGNTKKGKNGVIPLSEVKKSVNA